MLHDTQPKSQERSVTNTSGKNYPSERDFLYFRARFQNRVFQSVIAFFAEQAEKNGLTKAELAAAMQKDPAQIARWFSGPGNWTLDTVSDFLTAMNAEMSVEPISFVLARQGSQEDIQVIKEISLSDSGPDRR